MIGEAREFSNATQKFHWLAPCACHKTSSIVSLDNFYVRGVSEKFQDWDQTTNFLLQSNPLRLTHFLILFCHASMQSWKDSSGICFNSVVTAFLMASIFGKQTPLMTSLSLGNRKNHKEQVRWVGRMIQHGDVSLGQELTDAQALWAGALSWWSSHALSCHNSRLFSRTEWSKRRRISL